jgi:hypothetical protein
MPRASSTREPQPPFDDLWRTFLARVVLARNIDRIARCYGRLQSRDLVEDELIASLLMQRLVTLVEKGLGEAVAARGLKLTVHERCGGLMGRIACLSRLGYVSAAPTLRALCLTGDAIGRDPHCLIDWQLLERYIGDAQAVLLDLGVIGEEPGLVFYENRLPTTSGEPGIYMQYSIVFGVEDSMTHVSLVELTGRYSSPRA